MNKSFFLTTALLVGISSCAFAAAPFTVTSTDITQGQRLGNKQVFNGFGCSGENISPQFSWTNAPAGTKSFAITAFDPDAPTGSGWWHWTVVNIGPDIHSVITGAGDRKGNKLPQGAIQGKNDFGYAGFGGACPPAGSKPHRYRFTVWALKVEKLPITNDSSGAMVSFMLNNNVIEKTQLTATFGR